MAMTNLWTETYRPSTVDDYVFRDEQQRQQVATWIKEGTIPHLIFSGAAGIGKTTLAKILIKQLGVDDFDVMEINASRTNSVDDIRDTVINFVSTMPFGKFKIVLLDECLDENTPVVIKRIGSEMLVPIKDVDNTTDLVKSYNVKTSSIEWKPFDLFDKGTQETLSIEFENGEVVVCTPEHKWYVENEQGDPIVVKASELEKYNHILTS